MLSILLLSLLPFPTPSVIAFCPFALTTNEQVGWGRGLNMLSCKAACLWIESTSFLLRGLLWFPWAFPWLSESFLQPLGGGVSQSCWSTQTLYFAMRQEDTWWGRAEWILIFVLFTQGSSHWTEHAVWGNVIYLMAHLCMWKKHLDISVNHVI